MPGEGFWAQQKTMHLDVGENNIEKSQHIMVVYFSWQDRTYDRSLSTGSSSPLADQIRICM